MTDPDLFERLKPLIEEFSRSPARTLHVRSGSFELLLAMDAGSGTIGTTIGTTTTGPAPAPVAVPAAAPSAAPAPLDAPSAAAVDLPPDAMIVRAPNLGTFYRAPKPGAEHYVEVGAIVAVGQELCLIEVMKLFTAVRAEQAGRVHAVLAEDGSMVEAGQPLFALVNA